MLLESNVIASRPRVTNFEATTKASAERAKLFERCNHMQTEHTQSNYRTREGKNGPSSAVQYVVLSQKRKGSRKKSDVDLKSSVGLDVLKSDYTTQMLWYDQIG